MGSISTSIGSISTSSICSMSLLQAKDGSDLANHNCIHRGLVVVDRCGKVSLCKATFEAFCTDGDLLMGLRRLPAARTSGTQVALHSHLQESSMGNIFVG